MTSNTEYSREWKRRNRDKVKVYERKRWMALRGRVLVAYGCKCACCGETEAAFLAIDHVEGGGTAHRKARGPHQVMLDIIHEGFPADYRLLCHNCNQARSLYGLCPHDPDYPRSEKCLVNLPVVTNYGVGRKYLST